MMFLWPDPEWYMTHQKPEQLRSSGDLEKAYPLNEDQRKAICRTLLRGLEAREISEASRKLTENRRLMNEVLEDVYSQYAAGLLQPDHPDPNFTLTADWKKDFLRTLALVYKRKRQRIARMRSPSTELSSDSDLYPHATGAAISTPWQQAAPTPHVSLTLPLSAPQVPEHVTQSSADSVEVTPAAPAGNQVSETSLPHDLERFVVRVTWWTRGLLRTKDVMALMLVPPENRQGGVYAIENVELSRLKERVTENVRAIDGTGFDDQQLIIVRAGAVPQPIWTSNDLAMAIYAQVAEGITLGQYEVRPKGGEHPTSIALWH